MTLRCTLCLFFAALCLRAQSSWAELHLRVSDPDRHPVPAHVTLASQAVGFRRTLQLGPTGDYTFRALPPGRYQLSIVHTGLASQSALLDLRAGLPVDRQVTLSLPQLQSRIDVNESATLLATDRTNSSYYIGTSELRDRSSAASPGRGLIDLIAAQPGWTLEANGILHPRESEYDTQFVVNGIPEYENRSPAFAPAVEPENIESVTVLTGGIPAEFGQKLGGIVQVNTARNTAPGFHGSAALQGGSFTTIGAFVNGQYTAGKTTFGLTGQGFLTDRFLDPPTTANNTNHASNSSAAASFERDLTDADHLRIWASRRETRFNVPNDFVQQDDALRVDRASHDVEGAVAYQHVFTPNLLGSVRGAVRDITAQLWPEPTQDRGYREGYLNSSLAGEHGVHNWKAGTEARWGRVREQFDYVDIHFQGRALDREQSAYLQDTIRLRSFTVNAGLRFDHYSLLVDRTGWSPRLALAWSHQPWGLVLHASYDRTFGTPPFENILVSASAGVRTDNGFYLPIQPSRGNYYEAGLSKALGAHARFDATWFLRRIQNALDDDLLLNTGVSFPITYNHSNIAGTEAKLSVPRWGRFSGYLSYSNANGSAYYPVAGGLFTGETLPLVGRFPVTQDVRNTAHALARYQISNRIWTSWTALYSSGLPVEGNLAFSDSQVEEYGANVVSRVNFERGRVRPSFALNASIGAELWRREPYTVAVQADGMNLTNHLNVINFTGLFSGTAVAQPLSAGVRFRVDF